MATLAAIEKKIAALHKQAQALRKAQSTKMAATVKAMIVRHGLTAEDLGLAGVAAGRAGARTAKPAAKPGPKKAGTATPGKPRYQDPASGKTWTGVGKPPGWIANAKDRSALLIDGAASAAPASKRPKAAKPTKPAVVSKRAKAVQVTTTPPAKKAKRSTKAASGSATAPATKD